MSFTNLTLFFSTKIVEIYGHKEKSVQNFGRLSIIICFLVYATAKSAS